MSIQIAVLEPSEILRAGLRVSSQTQPFRIAYCTSRYRDCVPMSSQSIRADIVLFDPAVVIAEADEGLETLRRDFPTTRLIAWTEHYNPEVVNTFVNGIIAGCICKTVSAEELAVAVSAVHEAGSTSVIIRCKRPDSQ